MDLIEIIRKIVLATAAADEVCVALFEALTPSALSIEEIEKLVQVLNNASVWIVED
jgi:hypothetical protein